MFDVVLFLVCLAWVQSNSQPPGNETYFLGQFIHVPDTDLLGSVPNGMHLFPLSMQIVYRISHCTSLSETQTISETQKRYIDLSQPPVDCKVILKLTSALDLPWMS